MVSTSALLINVLLFITAIYAQTYTTCTNLQNFNACEQLNRSETIQCVIRKNSVDCLLLVENGNVSFTSVSAEEGFLASALTSNLVVVGEFVDPSSAGVFDYETAILVRKDLSNGFASLRGAKFCHPGIDNMQTSPLILKEFETEALNQNNAQTCTDGRRTIENYLTSVNDFFGSSCRPGKWSIVNNTLDTELKQTYFKLMELCNDISYLENQHLPYVQSLNCLLGGRGDIALTTLNAIKNSESYPDILTKFTLLCKNGTNVNVTEGCSWSRQPGYLLIGNKAHVTNLPRELEVWFRNSLYNSSTIIELPIENTDLLDLSEKFVQILKELLFPSQSHLINVITNTSTLETFIKERRDVPTPDKAQLCKSSVSICTTTTNEEQKCKWLQQAALNYGMQPVIYCTPKADKTECLNALQRSAVDMTIVNESMMYTANRMNLSIIAIGEEDRRYMKKSVLVVNSGLIKSLEDLRGKRGCFSEYGDIAWLSFTDTIRKQFWPNPNEYATELSQFLNVSCMPGIEDKETRTFSSSVYDHLCDICEPSYFESPIRRTCKPDWTNDFYGSIGALKCLGTRGDFAVLILQDNLTLPNNTVIMCKNGTLANTNDTNIEDDCALSVTAKDVIVVRNSDSKNRDIELLLQEIDERFAAQTHTPFKIFDRFGTQQDLIFADHTIGLEIASASTNKYIRAQIDMFTNIPGTKSTNTPDDGDFAARIETNLFLYASVLVILAFRYF